MIVHSHQSVLCNLRVTDTDPIFFFQVGRKQDNNLQLQSHNSRRGLLFRSNDSKIEER